MSIRVGTSSWADPGFVAEWYPPDLPERERLPWYARHFDAVEVNSTFYAVPPAKQVQGWAERTPEHFTFDVKLHRALSRHAAPLDSLPPDLRDGAATTSRGRVRLDAKLEAGLADRVLETVEPLVAAGKFGAFLLQLSPAFSPREHSLDELAPLIERLAETAWLEAHGAAWVSVDAPQADKPTIMPPVDAVTTPRLAYFRAHGRNLEGYVSGRSVPERFGWRYDDDELEEIRARVQELASRADEVHVAFNNNRGGDAPAAAERFRELIGG
jgi:uncharacterized protein YecE (DUF72 family)